MGYCSQNARNAAAVSAAETTRPSFLPLANCSTNTPNQDAVINIAHDHRTQKQLKALLSVRCTKWKKSTHIRVYGLSCQSVCSSSCFKCRTSGRILTKLCMHVMPFEVTPYSILNFLQLAETQKGGQADTEMAERFRR